ncbi:uncharacterized protein TNCT_130391 [Trichonephila clavata]|uniref:Uncharacterized protein n=1 Tax=Trichonephila clavata TaxID=2740835 RepID=A0A8X6IZ14_TRICU|nr:uncharacterized protein TNCT_130391 [Trichonephila clavata]
MLPEPIDMDIEITSPQDTGDSETESLIVHSNGDACIDDLLSENECETDVEIGSANGIKSEYLNHRNDPSFLKSQPRAQTRLLSRSHSANDLSQPDTLSVNSLFSEPPRRNSSGEYPCQLFESNGPSAKPLCNMLLQDIEVQKKKGNHVHRNSLTPTSSLHPTPVSMQYASPTPWKNIQTPHQDREDDFSILLQTTAERVLNKLKSRQQDLGCNLTTGQKYQRRPSHGLQPPVPRKLQPILRDGNKTPRSESDLKSISGDSDLGPLSAA